MTCRVTMYRFAGVYDGNFVYKRDLKDMGRVDETGSHIQSCIRWRMTSDWVNLRCHRGQWGDKSK